MAYVSKSKQMEIEAGRLEGLEPLPPELKKVKKEYDNLNSTIAKANARKAAIQTEVALELDKLGMKMFVEDGLNAFGYINVTTTSVDRAKLETEFPEIAALVISTKEASRFYSRK